MNLESREVLRLVHFQAHWRSMGDAEPRTTVGAILVGGRSRRMGTDKAMVRIGGTTLLGRMAKVMNEAGIADIVVLGGPEQWALDAQLRWRGDPEDFGGPAQAIGALLAELHEHQVVEQVVILACDLVRSDASVIARLLRASEGHQVAVARTDRLHPTAACWPTRLAPALSALIDGGERRLTRLVESLGAVAVDIVPAALMDNCNTPDDLARLHRDGFDTAHGGSGNPAG
jgi:molybdenum cofactor guanylyltransferase